MHEHHNQRIIGETLITSILSIFQLFESWCFDFHCSSIGLKIILYVWNRNICMGIGVRHTI